MVDARQEHEVEVGLALGKRCAEVLSKPRERLGRGEGLARNMGSGGSILQHGNVAVVLLREARVGAKSLDAEVGESEALAFGYIDGSIDIQQIGRTAMRLISGDAPMRMRPPRPLGGEIFQEKLAQRLAVVAHHAAVSIGTERVLLTHNRYIGLQVVAATLLEIGIEPWRPVRPIHLIGIIEHRMREQNLLMGKGCVEACQVVRHGITVEMINHQALSPRSRPLHLLTRQPHREMLLLVKDHLLRRILLRHQGTSKRPARPRRHIRLDAQLLTACLHILQHTHPTGRKIRNIVGFIPLHPIDWRNLHATNAHLGELGQVIIQPHRIHRTAQPPPSSVRLRFLADGNLQISRTLPILSINTP